ncbi:pilin [Nitrosovibrio sp. Nv17]|uniref:pilin n=1 Tax=Nitrosovibrio sp. Nv17 TaxID=1855339 RepID=UPI000908A55A|nr:pilin [Nitrosovibrio sp. Nv17]SFW19925.1 type IV pilus assembly protein PilA [Nitrosovibrio sp. Nv17]
MKQHQSGLTLIETMMALAAVGILATIAIPPAYQLYRDAVARDHVAEVLGLLEAAQPSISEFRRDNGRWPTKAEFEELFAQRTHRYITQLAPRVLPSGYQVTATFKEAIINAGLPDESMGRTLVMATRDGIRWICNDSSDPATGVPGLVAGTVLPQHRPPACK